MARPRSTSPLDPFSDLNRKTEILEKEMSAQRVAIERLKELGIRKPQPLRATASRTPSKRRLSR
jgi:hypothetical protein